MTRSADSFNRRGAIYDQQPTVLVICEDTKSSKTYLEALAGHFRSGVKVVDFDHCGNTDPLGIVRAAIKRKRDYECVYCVIDRDSHENFDQAINYASGVGVKTIVSYPCFEYWLLLHFGCNRKPFVRTGNKSAGDNVVAELRKQPQMNNYQKGGNHNWFALLFDKYEIAKRNAVRTLDQARREGEVNPSTELHILIDTIEKLSEPKPAKA